LRELEKLNQEIIQCRACPRLVRYREQVAQDKRRSFLAWDYWGKPVRGATNSGACACGAWRESHRANVYRRSLWRFFVQGPVSRGVCQSGYFRESRRWACVEECVYGRNFALRASCEQAFALGAGELPALFGERFGDPTAARGAGPGEHRDAGLSGIAERARSDFDAGCVSFSAWREL